MHAKSVKTGAAGQQGQGKEPEARKTTLQRKKSPALRKSCPRWAQLLMGL
jgi:hypothetical protein